MLSSKPVNYRKLMLITGSEGFPLVTLKVSETKFISLTQETIEKVRSF